MANVNFVWDVTLGNLITGGLGVVGFAMLWQRMNDRVEDNSREIERSQKELNEVVKLALPISINQHERRLNTLEGTLSTLQATLSALQTDIAWIKEAISKIRPTKT